MGIISHIIIHGRHIEQLTDSSVLGDRIAIRTFTTLLKCRCRRDKSADHVVFCPVQFRRIIRFNIWVTLVGSAKVRGVHLAAISSARRVFSILKNLQRRYTWALRVPQSHAIRLVRACDSQEDVAAQEFLVQFRLFPEHLHGQIFRVRRLVNGGDYGTQARVIVHRAEPDRNFS